MDKPIGPVTTGLARLLTAAFLAIVSLPPVTAADQDTAKPPDTYDAAMRQGNQLAGRGQYPQALDCYKRAYSLSKKQSCEALLAVGTMYRAMGDHQGAMSATKDALKLAGADRSMQARALNLKGASLVSLAEKPADKKYTEAEQVFRTALEANPALHEARLNLGITLLKQERDEEGLRELKMYVERVPPGRDTATVMKIIADPRRARLSFAPEFSFTTRQGALLSLESLKGKTIVIDFWGSWCGPCRAATPELIKLHRKYSELGVVFVGVARDETRDWGAYIDKNKMEWAQYLDEQQTVVRAFGVHAFPTYVVIDGEGVILARQSGAEPGWLESEIKKALKESGRVR